MAGAGKRVEPAGGDTFHQRRQDRPFNAGFLQAAANRARIFAERQHFADAVAHNRVVHQHPTAGIAENFSQRVGAFGGGAGAGDEIVLFILLRHPRETYARINVQRLAQPAIGQRLLAAKSAAARPICSADNGGSSWPRTVSRRVARRDSRRNISNA